MTLAITISGYGGMVVGNSAAAHAFAAALGRASPAIRLLAFTLDGSLRPWRRRPSGRGRPFVAQAAALVGFAYSALHSFAADGDGGSVGSSPIAARVGHS